MPTNINVAGVGIVQFPDGMKEDEIKAILDRDFGPNSKNPPTVLDQLKDSPLGGIVRGLRDLPDAGAQLLTEGLDAITPDGTAVGDWIKSEKKRVADINRAAEVDYQQNWRRGRMGDSIDVGRIGGQVLATAPLAGAVAPIRAGMSVPQVALRGGVQGAVSSALTQPVQNTEDAGFWEQKGMQTGVGAGFGAGGAVVADALGTAIQGARRANNPPPPRVDVRSKNFVKIEPTLHGTGGGSVLGTVGPDPTSALTSTQRAVMQRGKDLGLKVTPGQASGSRSLQQMEARMESSPMFSGPFNTLKINNQQSLNKAVAKGIGETSDVIDSAVLSQAETRLGNIFDNVADAIPKARVPGDTIKAVAQIEQDIDGIATKSLKDNMLVRRVVGVAMKGQATGKELRSLSSQLGRAAKLNMKTDPEFGMALFKVKDLVDGVVSNNLDEITKGAFDEARGQYRNLMTLYSRQNILNPSSGNVSGTNLASALMSRDKAGYTLGRNQSPMYDAARFAQAFKPLVNDSGTATRSMQMGPMDWMLSLPTSIASSLYLSQPMVNMATKTGNGMLPNAAGDALANFLRESGGVLGPAAGFQTLGGR